MSKRGSTGRGEITAATVSPKSAGKAKAAGKGTQESESGKRRSTRSTLIELVLIIAVAVGLAYLIQALIVKPYKIPTGSMEPTLEVGQRVLVDRIGNDFSEPHVGAIVVFHPPEGSSNELCGPHPHLVTPGMAACDMPIPKPASATYIKRIVAGPGDWLYIKEGHAYLSTQGRRGPFRRERDSYIKPCAGAATCSFLTPIQIPKGHWFMMGDNRGNSDDSRFWGPVPRSWIIGEAFATYWPPDRIGVF
jgi:signal peptidase I